MPKIEPETPGKSVTSRSRFWLPCLPRHKARFGQAQGVYVRTDSAFCRSGFWRRPSTKAQPSAW